MTIAMRDQTQGSRIVGVLTTFASRSSVVPVGIAAVLVAITGAILVGPGFFSADTLYTLSHFVSLSLIVGAFASFGLLAGVPDLSIGASIAFSAAVFAALGAGGFGFVPSLLATLAVGVAIGAINAVVVVGVGVNSVAATLGSLMALIGATLALTGDDAPTYLQGDLFRFTISRVGPFSPVFLIGVALILVSAGIVGFTRFGRHIKAVGGDPVAASRAGIRLGRLRVLVFLLSGLGGSVAGVFFIGENGSASATSAQTTTFQIFAALMIGGFSLLRGGVGTPLGGLLGVLVIGGVGLLLDDLQVDYHYLDIVTGCVLIVAILIDRLRGGEAFE